jgi:AcrR family transcriptional regulator
MSTTWSDELEDFRSQQRKRVVDAAERVFLSKDLPQARMTDISAAAGVSRPTLYKYFNSIEELAYEVQMRALGRLYEAVAQRTRASHAPPLERIKIVFEACLSFFDTHVELIRFMGLFDHYFRSADHSPDAENRYIGFLQRFSILEKVIREGQQDGSIKASLDAHNTAIMLENTLTSMLQKMALRGQLLSQEQEIDPRAQLEAMFAMMLDFLIAD